MKLKVLIIIMIAVSRLNLPAQPYSFVDLSSHLPAGAGNQQLIDMSWVSPIHGWICSRNSGEIYHTTNGGINFTTHTASTSPYVTAIYMLNAAEGFSTGSMARVMHTTDTGNTWPAAWYAASDFLALGFPPGASAGYACGNAGWIFNVSGTGISVSTSSAYNSYTLRDISFPSNNGWVCGNNLIGHYNGSSWLNDQSFPNGNYNAVYMLNDSTGWAVGDTGQIVKTTDGISWTAQTNPDPYTRNLNDVFFPDTLNGFAVGDSGIILYTANGGSTWSIESGIATPHNLNTIQFPDPFTGYIAGDSSTFIKIIDLTSYINGGTVVSADLSISPNPASDHCNISITTPLRQYADLAVYDLQGKLVEKIFSNEIPAGITHVIYNTSDLQNGIYFIGVRSGNKKFIKKIIIQK